MSVKHPTLRRLLSPVLALVMVSALTITVPVAKTHANDVWLNVGDDFQSIVNANPAGTTYRIAAGLHRMQSVTPKNGDLFIGQLGAEMRGSKVLNPTNAQQSNAGQTNGLYFFDNQTQQNLSPQPFGTWARTGHERATSYGNELFVNGQRQRHVNSLAEVNAPGRWYFDDDNDRIYMFDNPNNGVLETSATSVAFDLSNTSDVTIENLKVTQHANTARPEGAIRGGGTGERSNRTIVRYVDASNNHSAGIGLSANMTVQNSRITKNGQIGLSGGGGTPLIQNNELAFNKELGYANTEAGANKVKSTDGGYFENNWIHDNNGFGLWFDVYNSGNHIRSNLVENNLEGGRGIYYEISGDNDGEPTRIYWNTVRNNNDGGIDVYNSTNVQILENAITSRTKPIDARDNPSRSPNLGQLVIRDNDIRTIQGDARHLRFLGSDTGALVELEGNTYRGVDRFEWFDGTMITLTELRARGFEINGQVLVGNTDAPQLPAHAKGFTQETYGPVAVPDVTIYRESFLNQEGKGVAGSQTDTTGVTWTVDVTDATLSDTADFFRVTDDGKFTAVDTDGAAVWRSPVLDISGFTDIQLSLDIAGSGDFESNQDDFLIQYILDGQTFTVLDAAATHFIDSSQLGDKFDAPIGHLRAGIADGDDLLILITASTSFSSEILSFDNVRVEGNLKQIPEPSTLACLGLGASVLLRRRHRPL